MNSHVLSVKTWIFASTSVLVGLTQFAAPAQSWPLGWFSGWQAGDRAVNICVDAASARGFRVEEVVEQNEFSGGAEVIMRVRSRYDSALIGCDYADNTRQVQLYQLESGRNTWEDNRDDDDDNDDDDYNDNDYFDDRYSEGRINNRRDAETMARQVIEDELGVDANSDIIRIGETRRNRQVWYVAGDVNGAPFEVEIRRDGSVADFRLR
jgi:hypothetical protein